jgi:hypothetical protein
MAIDRATLERWYAGEEISGVLFRLNDSVVTAVGIHVRGDASVISLFAVRHGSSPRYPMSAISARRRRTCATVTLRNDLASSSTDV